MKNVLLTGLAVLSLTACTDDIKDDIFDLQGDLALEQARLHHQANRIDDLQSELNTLTASVNLEITQINTTLVALAAADDVLLGNIEGVQAELVSAVASLTQADASNLIVALDAVTEAETSLVLLLQENVEVLNASIQSAVASSTSADADLQAQLDAATLALSNAVSVLTSNDTATLAQAITAVSNATEAAEIALATAVGDQATVDANQDIALTSAVTSATVWFDAQLLDLEGRIQDLEGIDTVTVETLTASLTALQETLETYAQTQAASATATSDAAGVDLQNQINDLTQAIADIQLLAGPQGEQGVQGVAGEDGADGQNSDEYNAQVEADRLAAGLSAAVYGPIFTDQRNNFTQTRSFESASEDRIVYVANASSGVAYNSDEATEGDINGDGDILDIVAGTRSTVTFTATIDGVVVGSFTESNINSLSVITDNNTALTFTEHWSGYASNLNSDNPPGFTNYWAVGRNAGIGAQDTNGNFDNLWNNVEVGDTITITGGGGEIVTTVTRLRTTNGLNIIDVRVDSNNQSFTGNNFEMTLTKV